MKKQFRLVIFLPFLFAGQTLAQGMPSAEKMEDFHPEIAAGEVPTPKVTEEEDLTDHLAVVPFETATAPQKENPKVQNFEIYPLNAQQKRERNSEPDNPVNNVTSSASLKTAGKNALAAPLLKTAPPEQFPQPLFGRAAGR